MKQIKHYEVIQALLSEPTIKDACKKLGVSRATLFNYTKKQEVKDTVHTAIFLIYILLHFLTQ